MANVYLTQEPSLISAGENPIIIGLSTGTVGSPQYSKTRFVVNNNPGDGFKINFVLTEPDYYVKAFYAKDFPNADNYFLTNVIKDRYGNTVQTGITLSQIAGSLAQAFQSDLVLSKYYYIQNTGDTVVTLTAKEPSARFKLDSSNISVTNGSLITFNKITDGADRYQGSQVQDFNLYVELFQGDKQYGESLNLSDFNRITELQLPFSNDNKHQFELSNICKSFLSTSLPNLNVTGLTTVADYIKPFGVRYGQMYPVVINENTKKKFAAGQSNFFWVTNASLDYSSPNDHSIISLNPRRFVTNSPELKTTNRDQKELLYFLVSKNVSQNLYIYANIKYWDSSIEQDIQLANLNTSNLDYGGMVCVNVSYDALGLEQIESSRNKKIKNLYVFIASKYAQDERLLNNDFTTSITGWTQSGAGAPFSWSSTNGGSARAVLGTTTGIIQSGVTTFNTDLQGWFNTSNGVTPATGGTTGNWVWSSDFGGCAKATTTTSGCKILRLSNVHVPQQAFDVNIKWSINNAPASTLLSSSFLIRNSSNSQLFNQQFQTIKDGTLRTTTFHITSSTIWTNADHFLLSVGSTNFVAGDTISVSEIEIVTTGTTTFYQSSYLEQYDQEIILNDGANLNLPPTDHILSYSTTFNTSNTALHVAYFDSVGALLSQQVLYSGGTGLHTGTTIISAAIAPQVYRVRFWFTNSGGTNQNVYLNKVSIKATNNFDEFTVTKGYVFPYLDKKTYGVLFQNKVGTYDTFNFQGLKEETIDRDTSEITYPIQYGDYGEFASGYKYNANYDTRVTKKIIVNSGFLNKETFDWLIELMSSNEIRSVDDMNYLKLDSYKYTKNNQSNEYNLECTFIKTINENNVSI